MRSGSPPFVGREGELRWLEDSLREALRGRPHLCLLAGEAGIGKSRLARELGALAAQGGARVAVGRGHESLRVPYLPVAEALRARLAGAGEDLAREDEALRFLLAPEALPGPAAAAPRPESGEGERRRFFLAAARLLLRLARREPTLLVVEDLHWADPPSLDLLLHLVGALADAALGGAVPVLLVCTYRPAEVGERLARVLGRLERETCCERAELRGLEEAETRRLLERLGGGRPSHQLVQTLHAATGGNPLFVQELVRHLRERDQIVEYGDYAFPALPAVQLELPADLAAALRARIRRLDAGRRRVLTLAAFLGERFALPALGALARTAVEPLTALCEEAAAEGLLAREGEGYRFAHPLLRHAFLGAPPPRERRRIHRRVAEALECHGDGAPGERSAEIAEHLAAAGAEADVRTLVAYARRAAERAAALFAWGEAARHLAAAVARAEAAGGLSAQERGDLHFQAGYLCHYDWDPGPCRDHYEKAARAYREARDARGLATVLNQQVRATLALGGASYGTLPDLKPLEEALAALGEEAPLLRALACYTMAEAHWAARQPQQADAMARRALELGRELGDERSLRNACLALGLARHQSLRIGEALASWQQCLEHARRARDPWLENAPRQRMCVALAELGRLEEAAAAAGKAESLARRTQDPGETSLALANLASLAVARGEFAEAERRAREAMALVDRSRYAWSGALALLAVACARAQRGELAESADALALLVEPGRVFDDPGPLAALVVPVHRALLRAYDGAEEAADEAPLADLANAVRLLGADAELLWLAGALVESAAHAGAADAAAAPAAILGAAAERGMLFTPCWTFLIPRVLGVAAALAGRPAEAEEHFAAALPAAEAAGAAPELGRTALDWARLLARRGDRERAAELVQRAAGVFAAHGMRPFWRRARELAGALGVPLGAEMPEREVLPGGLDRREAEVLRRLARGQREEEIAAELLLRPETVRGHVAAIFQKTGARGRTAAAGYAFEQGLLAWREETPAGPLLILVTDLEGFTPLVERLGDARAREVIHEHNRILRACLRRRGGAEITHTGDGIMASFTDGPEALRCALDVQGAFARYSAEHPETRLRARIGLNAGRPLLEEDRLFGSAINAAVRICGQAPPGSILVSDGVRRLTAREGFAFASRGAVELKGFVEPVWLHELASGG